MVILSDKNYYNCLIAVGKLIARGKKNQLKTMILC
jgi:hypothetical protein